ncbi:MAG TPA: S41 family peptidase [Bryobacteraceae bacterium]|nr:S41 family peptidase [Bryobacteraceae bacterium]
MKRIIVSLLFLGVASTAFGQLTQAQKVADFTALAALYDKNYEPYEFKRDVIGFDLLNLTPWLAQVNATKDDLSFYDVCVRYVASLKDSHDEFILNANFEAFLPFTVDIYDGKVLVDFIDRISLPSKNFPFQVGDEMVSVDGTTVADWITALQPYTVNGSANAVSRNRLAASMIIDRYQGWYPFASKIGTTAVVVFRRQNGNLETDNIAWQLFGTPLAGDGLLPNPKTSSAIRASSNEDAQRFRQTLRHHGRLAQNAWGLDTTSAAPEEKVAVPDYMAPLENLRTMGYKHANLVGGSISPFDSRTPLFAPPAGFKLRLGSKSSDFFLSGTFPAGKLNIGFIRIPSMSPSSQNAALNQFLAEVIFFQQNTDGLVIDVMGNGGGSICYTNVLLQMLNPTPFRQLGFQLRATQTWVNNFSGALTSAKLNGSPQYVIDLYTAFLAEVQQAQAQNRGSTGPLPLCGVDFEHTQPLKDQTGAVISYTKPIVVLTDNFTLSAGELFTATLQDAKRATVYGTRTDGGGGSVVEFNTTPFSEGFARVTLSLAIRAQPVTTPGFPSLPLIENIGAFPDVAADYMTVDNLNKGGATFVTGFTTLISNLVNQGHP